ncbi:hypothetical protein BC941DRAFT_428919 [Chlamydoabsidia padenii]|nr:hypothetical protein BC941DRAFT_428919 [Chlamydoabsidia padenii]
MSVQAAVAFLNGNETNPTTVKGRGLSNAVNRPAPSKPTTWATSIKAKTNNAPTLYSNKKDDLLAKTGWTKTTDPLEAQTTKDSIPVKPISTINSKPSINKLAQPTRSSLDKHAEGLTALYQEALDNYQSASATITKLEADVELYACDSTKVRDYEIRVEYLAQKLEQISEERDLLEQELATYKDQKWNTSTSPATDIPQAPIEIAVNDKQNTNITGTMNIIHDQQVDDAYYDDILDAYEERQSQVSENNNDIQHKQQHEQMMLMEQLLAEYDQGMKMAMETYVADLEKQRLENKTLKSMVKKQDELIKKLEAQCNNNNNPDNTSISSIASQQQHIHTRQRGSENTYNRTTKKPTKRDNGTKKVNNETKQQQSKQQRKPPSPSYRSSIDVLEEMAKTDNIPASLSGTIRPTPSPQHYPYHHHHHQRDTGRSTPPPFAPPRTPLPPLPTSHSSSSLNTDSGPTSYMSPIRNSLISYSRSSTSSNSWSSDEQNQHSHPLSIMALPLPKHTNTNDHGNTNYSPLVRSLDNTMAPSPPTSFWKGLKKRF